MLSFFHLIDETDLDRWQSGLERADGSHRPSYDAVKQTIAQTHGNCPTTPVSWRHRPASCSRSQRGGASSRSR